MKKILFSALTVAFTFSLRMLPASAYDNTQCPVVTNTEGNLGSLQSDIDSFNRTEYRNCTERIIFREGQEFDIVATDTYEINNNTDKDFDSDGINLEITGEDADVVIDGTHLPKDQCVFLIDMDHVTIKDVTIRVWDKRFAICDYGSDNHFSNVTIIETKRIFYPFRVFK